MTKGPLLAPLVALAAPIVAGQLLQVVYNLTDTFWVGRLGADAVSALSFSFPVVFLMIGGAGGFTAGGSVLVAQSVGSNDGARARTVAGQTLALTGFFTVVLCVAGYFATPHLLTLVGTPQGTEIFEMAVDYTRVMFLGNFAIFGFFAFQAVFRGWGDTRTPLFLLAFGVGLNLLVDPVFILGFDENPLFMWMGLSGVESVLFNATGFRGFGVQGAAIATVIARGLGTAVGLGLLFGGYAGPSVSLDDLRPRANAVRRVVGVAWPLAFERTLTPIGITATTAIVATVGADAVAGYGIGTRYVALVFLPAIGLANATEAAVGQNLGAGFEDRAHRVTVISTGLVCGVMGPLALVFFLMTEPLVSIFVTGDGASTVVSYGAGFLSVFAVAFPFLGVLRVIVAAFGGAGHSRKALTVSLVRVFGLQIPLLLVLLALGGGPTSIWYGITAAVVVTALLAAGWFAAGTWRQNGPETTTVTGDD